MAHLSVAPTGDLEELRARYVQVLGAACGVAAWLTAVRLTSFNPRWNRTWPVVVILLVGFVGARLLGHERSERFRPAPVLLALSLTAALMAEEWLIGGLAATVLLPALVVLAAGVSSALALVTALAGLGGLLAVHLAPEQPLSSPQLVSAALTLLAVTSAALVAARQFHRAFGWARSSANRAELAAREAQKRREEAMSAMQALRNAYYLIERTNHALAQAQAELVEARRLKTDFVNTVSHELRAPLNFIVGFSELMVNNPEVYGDVPWPEGLRQDIEDIYLSSSHLARLIDDILDLAQIEAHRMILRREEADVSEIAREAADMIRPWLARRGLTFTERYQGDLPPLYLDRTRIRQVILNLLNNAARFTERGAVSLLVKRQDDYALVSVSDTGPGTEPSQLSRIFQEFVQLDTGRGRSVGGSGLGLAICRRFVEMHGGRIWAESTPGQGSTFHVSLPIGSSPPVASRTDALSLETSYWQTLQRQGLGRDVIVAVSDKDATDALRRALPDSEVAAVDCTSLADAVERLRPRAVVVDSSQAPLDRVQAALSSSPHDVPVIALPFPGTHPDPNLAGISAHLTKPVTRARLLEAISRACPAAEQILIVEDDPRMRRFLATTLESASPAYRVETVATGEEGIRRLRDAPPHLLLLDLCLPDISGFEVLQTVSSDQLLQGIPVITISAYINPADDQAAGPTTILASRRSPLTYHQILSLLKTALEEMPPRYCSDNGSREPELLAQARVEAPGGETPPAESG